MREGGHPLPLHRGELTPPPGMDKAMVWHGMVFASDARVMPALVRYTGLSVSKGHGRKADGTNASCPLSSHDMTDNGMFAPWP